jgi:hypothetical protein
MCFHFLGTQRRRDDLVKLPWPDAKLIGIDPEAYPFEAC